MAQKPRRWTGSRTPGALKRVRQQVRREAVNRPRRTAAKTYVAKAIRLAATGAADETREVLIQAVSALDRAARNGSIHRNAAARRKSRLMLKINAALGGESLVPVARPTRTTGRAAAAKAARARVAAAKATKAKGEQTAAGKARAALSRTTRGESAAPSPTAATAAAPATRGAAKATTSRTTAASRRPMTGATRTAAGARQPAKTTATRSTAAKSATRSSGASAKTRGATRSGTATKPAARGKATKSR